MNLEDVLKFQTHSRFISVGKDTLIILEKAHIRIKELESILIKMGINVDSYENSPFDYKKDRSYILGKINDASRECQSLLDGFKVELKK
jgi:hypothetical protein